MLKSSDNIYLLVFLGMCGMFLLSGAIILFYIRYQRKLHRQQVQMKEAEMEYQVQILQSTIQSQEDERRRIGQDLHDEVGGALVNLRLLISNVGKVVNMGALIPLVASCEQLTDDVINNVRHISHNLSPSGLKLFGFTEVLGELCERTSISAGIEIVLKNDAGKIAEGLEINTSIALYRVVQELLTNTLKHAGAQKICIIVTFNNNVLKIDYSDDGKGLEEKVIRNKGIGMFNIESRLSMVNATFEIGSELKKGFSMLIEVPIISDQKVVA